MKSKKILTFLLIFTIMASVVSVHAADAIPVTPSWANTMGITCDVTFSGRTAACSGSIEALPGATISATLTLYKKNGTAWDYVTSWNKNTLSSWNDITETYTVSSAGTYKVTMGGYVTLGTTVEYVTITSNEKICN